MTQTLSTATEGVRTVRIIKIPKYKRPRYIIKDVNTGANLFSLIESQSEALRLIDSIGAILEPDYQPKLWNGGMDQEYLSVTRECYGN